MSEAKGSGPFQSVTEVLIVQTRRKTVVRPRLCQGCGPGGLSQWRTFQGGSRQVECFRSLPKHRQVEKSEEHSTWKGWQTSAWFPTPEHRRASLLSASVPWGSLTTLLAEGGLHALPSTAVPSTLPTVSLAGGQESPLHS